MTLFEFRSMGGKARASKLSKERLKYIARMAAKARWLARACVDTQKPETPPTVYRKCQSGYCKKEGREVLVQGMKAWLCEEHFK